MQDTRPITTAISEITGRLKSGAGCSHNKKKCIKCEIKKVKDGKGGNYDGKGGIDINKFKLDKKGLGYGKSPETNPTPNFTYKTSPSSLKSLGKVPKIRLAKKVSMKLKLIPVKSVIKGYKKLGRI